MTANPDFFELLNDYMAFMGEPKWKNPEGAVAFAEDILMLMELDHVPEAMMEHVERKVLSGRLSL